MPHRPPPDQRHQAGVLPISNVDSTTPNAWQIKKEHRVNAFRNAVISGAAYVFGEADKRGYSPGDSTWYNLEQGQPETGAIPARRLSGAL
jgi:hypothetical protein